MEDETTGLCIEEMHVNLFINLFNKERIKNIYQKTRSLHTTAGNPTMGE
jgi:hypothetical protein